MGSTITIRGIKPGEKAWLLDTNDITRNTREYRNTGIEVVNPWEIQ